MKPNAHNLIFFSGIIVFSILLFAPTKIFAATITPASCLEVNVQSAINFAQVGDTVQIPAGNCSWTGVTLSKAITLAGAGVGVTNITLGDPSGIAITKSSAGVIRVTGFSFSVSHGGYHPVPMAFDIGGNWLGTEPVVVEGNSFHYEGMAMASVRVAGGAIFSGNTFTATYQNDFAIIVEAGENLTDSLTSWTIADSIGMHDSDGKKNVYIEDNTFNYGGSGMMDCADNCRVVLRHNTFVNTGYNSHGHDTSPYGTRHFEIYNNNFTFPFQACQDSDKDASGTYLSNVVWYVLIRGGTGVIFNNSFQPLYSPCWGDKPEIAVWVRGAEDVRPQGICPNVHYPIPRQVGQNNNGVSDFTDPIYLWGNTGTADPGNSLKVHMAGGWVFGNPCGFDWGDFIQYGRDIINTDISAPVAESTNDIQLEAAGAGTPKPGYVPYTYPHPLVSGSPAPPPPPPPPSDTTAPIISSIASSAITTSAATITWTSNENSDTQIDYGTTISYGSQTTLNSSLTTSHSQALANLSASTLYHYRVRSRDASGNLGISADQTFTTSASATPLPGDFNLDHIVNSLDYSLMNFHWFQTSNITIYDLVVDGLINTLDFAVLKNNWGRVW